MEDKSLGNDPAVAAAPLDFTLPGGDCPYDAEFAYPRKGGL